MITIKGDRFLINGNARPLAGNHTWDVVQPVNKNRTPIDRLTGNFTRLWTIETKAFVNSSPPFVGANPGLIRVENVPWRKDLSLNTKFYNALRKKVAAAEKRNMVTGVVLFEGSIPDAFPRGWEHHPFNGKGPKSHEQVHTKGPWNKHQRAHVREVVKTLAGFRNVIYEVGNELMGSSTGWFQKRVVKWVQKWSDQPVGVSYARGIRASSGRNEAAWMQRTGADWVSPTATAIAAGQFRGFKGPVVFDTDHSWPLRSNVAGLQSAVRAGRPVWLMDGFNGSMLRNIDNLQPDRDFIASMT